MATLRKKQVVFEGADAGDAGANKAWQQVLASLSERDRAGSLT